MYVLMAPFSAYDSREWPAERFADLSIRLHALGVGTVAIGSPGQADRLTQHFGPTFATWQYGQSPTAVAKLIAGAACVVGNDSGIAHYAGLLGAPTLAVHAGSLPHDYLFGDSPTIQSVTADAVLPRRDHDTAALRSITVDRVLAAVCDLIGVNSVNTRK